MTSLIDRYVYTALRRVPEEQRADIDRELRASVDDAVEARIEAGESYDAALEAALIELGDPDRMADGYANRRNYLIGPELFPIWRRILTRLLTTVLPLVVAIGAVIQWLDDPDSGKIIGGVINGVLTIGIQMAFWVTLAFVFVERSPATRDKILVNWTPKDLPKFEPGQLTRMQLASNLTGPVLLTAALVLQQFTFTSKPILDPHNWRSGWWPLLIVVFLLQCFYAVWVYRVGAWTRKVALVNAALVLLASVPVVWLLATDHFYNPAFIDSLDWGTADPQRWLTLPLIALAVFTAGWDIFETFYRAERARRGLPAKVLGSGNYNLT